MNDNTAPIVPVGDTQSSQTDTAANNVLGYQIPGVEPQSQFQQQTQMQQDPSGIQDSTQTPLQPQSETVPPVQQQSQPSQEAVPPSPPTPQPQPEPVSPQQPSPPPLPQETLKTAPKAAPKQQVQEKLPPPIGSPEEANKYLKQLISLIQQNKLALTHTDLKQYDPSTLQDHYRIDLGEYEIEVSHSKQADTNQDFYIMLFNNLKKIQEICTNKVILAYIHLTADQFKKFKAAADAHLEQKKIEAEKERFRKALSPIDEMLAELGGDIGTQAPEGVVQETPVASEQPAVEEPTAAAQPVMQEQTVPVQTPIDPAASGIQVDEVLTPEQQSAAASQSEQSSMAYPYDLISQMYSNAYADNQQAPNQTPPAAS